MTPGIFFEAFCARGVDDELAEFIVRNEDVVYILVRTARNLFCLFNAATRTYQGSVDLSRIPEAIHVIEVRGDRITHANLANELGCSVQAVKDIFRRRRRRTEHRVPVKKD